jgi:Fe-S oxidoreductase
MLDLKTATGVARMDALAQEVGRLVADYHGAVSGEHGCGRSRSWFLPELLGPDLYEAMTALKDAFDPRRLLNPGVVVDGPPVTESLRFGADYHGDRAWAPRLSYAAEGGFGPAVERCFGAGLCKKLTGTMCPPALVTRDEARSTRARANALQGVICGAVPLAAIGEAEFREVLGTCVACKACKTECPAGVDLAALKVEWLAEVRAREGVPPLARGIGDFRRLAALAAPAAPLVNFLRGTRAARAVTDRLGVAHRRPLPAFARTPLTRRLAPAPAPDAASGRTAVLFVDCFVQYQEPGVGEALARLLAAAGVRLVPADVGCCGRTALSTGQIEKARSMAARALAGLHPLVAGGAEVLFVEPSCLSMARDDWARLLPGDPRVAELAAASRPGLALVADLAAEGRLRFRAGGRALLHSHCHEKALGFAEATLAALAAVPGLEFDDPNAGCCGMSGVFGYEAEHYDLSVAMAERALLPAVRAAAPGTAVLATGTSCRAQIGDLSGRRAVHPLEFLAGRLTR